MQYILNSENQEWKPGENLPEFTDDLREKSEQVKKYLESITAEETKKIMENDKWQEYLAGDDGAAKDLIDSIWIESFASRNWVKNNYLIEISLSAEQYRSKMEKYLRYLWTIGFKYFTNKFFNIELPENQHVLRKLKKLKTIITIENDKSDDESDDELVLKYFRYFLVALKKRYDIVGSTRYQFDAIAEEVLNNYEIIDDSTTEETKEKFIKIISEAKIPKHSSKNGGKKKKTKHRKKKTKRRKKKTKKRRKTRNKRRKKR